VGPDTLFPLASCTKPFTSLALATLVDDAKLHWDDPVRKHLPYFKLADPLADANVTLRDLLCHRTGVGSHDLMWYGATCSVEERVRRVAHLELQHSFRSQFQYQVVLFGGAGLAAGQAAGSSWRQAIENRVLGPLGMKNSFAVAVPQSKYADQASPHRRSKKGDIGVIARYPLEEPDPAGTIHSTGRDLARFLRLQLGDGSWQGKRLVSAENLHETHTPQMIVRREGFAKLMNPETLQIAYGLGWIVQDYRGKQLVLHGGAIDGFRAQITLVPQDGIGVAVLSNLDRSLVNLALTQSILDMMWGKPARDWNAFYLELRRNEELQNDRRHEYFLSRRHKDAKPSLPLAAFAGAYHDPAYGTARIALENDALILRWSSFRWPLEHLLKDTFYISDEAVGDAPLEFEASAGAVDSFRFMDRTFRRHKAKAP
jgi:CubicO group peptidase (beta-lactamase class C family)